jgi:transcription termination/antitermination protein NusA
MKSEFLLAFNEICQERNLPQEAVIEALQNALISAYRRDHNASNMQQVTVEIDPRTGEPTIYAEKEVVEDDVVDDRTEVLLSVALAAGHKVELGDMVLMDSTPRNFGRIAAQTAKQVILQRVREAEREKLFTDYAASEGEIVNGTVQSITSQNVTVGLGRTEAILPKSQQVNSEKYRAHDKIRVYVLEVRRSVRGPQIVVSRNHRNLLRRLLELEVPEIYNGQVDIKSIAREAGQRSKVAVMALQPGVDPVGACVGMRGVRIQSIVRELNDEKIDVIEWDNDQRNFIAKALSPARVAGVFLEEHPDTGKTAVVIVPDDQLSLAIGREGQNARLAAKLTGWRIDIKSLTEAANDSLKLIGHADVVREVVDNEEFILQIRYILEKKSGGRPLTAEDFMALNKLVNAVEGQIITKRAAIHDELRKSRAAAKKRIPSIAWETDLIEFNLMHRTHNVLVQNNVTTVGAAMYQLELGDLTLLSLDGFGDKALEELKKAVKEYKDKLKAQSRLEKVEEVVAKAAEPTPVAVEAAVETEPAPPAEVQAELAMLEEAPAPIEDVVEVPAIETVETPDIVEAEVAVSELPAPEVEAEEEDEQPVAEVVEVPAPSVPDVLDDLAAPLVPLVKTKKQEPKPKPKKLVVVRTPDVVEEEDEATKKAKAQKGKEMVFDEELGRVVVKRKRKGNRVRNEWEDEDEF